MTKRELDELFSSCMKEIESLSREECAAIRDEYRQDRTDYSLPSGLCLSRPDEPVIRQSYEMAGYVRVPFQWEETSTFFRFSAGGKRSSRTPRTCPAV